MSSILNQTFTLPCGVTIKNRIGKAPMTEGLADRWDNASPELARVYERWADGGCGLSVTGNVMVDRSYLERPGNVVLEDERCMDQLRAWASAGTRNDTQLWMQISHPGRQSPVYVSRKPLAPSPIKVDMLWVHGKPRALIESEIQDIIQRFVRTAEIAKKTGFTGVQIHAAHGYLLSEFLSPLANKRSDQWGGSLENRARLLLECVRAIRAAVGSGYPLSVKLNSSDFQKGAFSEEDSRTVIQWLQKEGVDLIELSGGTYEHFALLDEEGGTTSEGEKVLSAASARREAYFIEMAQKIRQECDVPLMVSGGFRTLAGMEEAVSSGVTDLVGLGRPLSAEPDFANRLLDGRATEARIAEKNLALGSTWFSPASENRRIRVLNSFADVGWHATQIDRLGKGGSVKWELSPLSGMLQFFVGGLFKQIRRKEKKPVLSMEKQAQ